MITRKEAAFRAWYLKLLRDMKKAGLKVDDMPEDVAQSALAVHQHALEIEAHLPRRKP